MNSTLENLFQENLGLKKKLTTSKITQQKLEKDIKQLTHINDQTQKKLSEVRSEYNQLQRKYQYNLNESSKSIGTFTSQIEQLKNIIEQKQRDLQTLQLKMIPNVDQDMIRVKLISEMEGPYQQVVDKKDKEISKLKDKLNTTQRKLAIVQLNLSTKTTQYEKELEGVKIFYTSQNEKLMKQLSHLITKSQIKTLDQNLLKSLRKETQELRLTIGYKQKQIEENQFKIQELKDQRQRLYAEITKYRTKRAWQEHQNSKSLEDGFKEQRARLLQQITFKKQQVQRMERKLKEVEKQMKKIQNQYRKENDEMKRKYESERLQMKEQLREVRQSLRKQRENKSRFETDRDYESNRLILIQKQNKQLRKEIQILREKVHIHFHNPITPPIFPPSPHRDQDNTIEQKLTKKILQLQDINKRLKEKLEYANKKIIQLIKEKIGKKQAGNRKSFDESQFIIPQQFSKLHGEIQLQYRDTALIPLVPPMIYRLN